MTQRIGTVGGALPDPESWTQGAVAGVRHENGSFSEAPAAFVFLLSGERLAWVEPSYADPYGASSRALHYAGNVRAVENGICIEASSDAGWSVSCYPNDSEDGISKGVVDALAWFFDVYLKGEGRTWAEERERVLAMIMADEA
mgnify:CR=1 FL=1